VLIQRYRREFPPPNDTIQNRAVLVYEIMTTAFLTIGIGVSITLGSVYFLKSECHPYECSEVMALLLEARDRLNEANNARAGLETQLDVLRDRLAERLPDYGSEWIMRSASRIVELANERNITIDEAQSIIEEEFTRGL
jgi:hypothetical protein